MRHAGLLACLPVSAGPPVLHPCFSPVRLHLLMLARDSRLCRPSALQDVCELILECLSLEPGQRPTAQQVMRRLTPRSSK